MQFEVLRTKSKQVSNSFYLLLVYSSELRRVSSPNQHGDNLRNNKHFDDQYITTTHNVCFHPY